jgi:hypothetical protein
MRRSGGTGRRHKGDEKYVQNGREYLRYPELSGRIILKLGLK